MITYRGAVVVFAFGAAVFAMASCDSFSEGDASSPTDGGTGSADGATDSAPPIDSSMNVDASPDPDAAALACESVKSDLFATAAGVRMLVADATFVYAASSTGVWRRDVAAGTLTSISDDNASDVVLSDDHVVWRRNGGTVWSKSRGDPGADAGTIYASNNTTSIRLRTQNQVVLVRADDGYGCNSGGGACAGILLLHAGIQEVVPRGTTFDFTANDTDGVAVFHCVSGCTQPDAGTRLALGGQSVPALVSDETNLYWIDKSAGRVRRVSRANNGQAEDVMTGLLEPGVLALDDQGRILVGTTIGVFRGPSNGRCVAGAGTNEQVLALTAGPASAFMATATQVKKLRP